jgi:hypothetical protein
MSVTFSEPRDAAPIPWKRRNKSKTSNFFENIHRNPAVPNNSKEGTRIVLRPNDQQGFP